MIGIDIACLALLSTMFIPVHLGGAARRFHVGPNTATDLLMETVGLHEAAHIAWWKSG